MSKIVLFPYFNPYCEIFHISIGFYITIMCTYRDKIPTYTVEFKFILSLLISRSGPDHLLLNISTFIFYMK